MCLDVSWALGLVALARSTLIGQKRPQENIGFGWVWGVPAQTESRDKLRSLFGFFLRISRVNHWYFFVFHATSRALQVNMFWGHPL